jgi:hypothetical protein
MPMPEAQKERLGTIQLFKQLLGDGTRVVEAELALARSEAALTMRGYLVGFAAGAMAMATTIVALFAVAQACALAIAPFVAGAAIAYLIVGFVLAFLAAGLALISRHFFSRRHRPVGAVFKQLFGEPAAK